MKHWINLFRPWSLTATFVPIWLAACANIRLGANDTFMREILLALLACGSLQIACNLLNTWGDWKSGADNKDVANAEPELVNGSVTPRGVLEWAATWLGVGFIASGILLYRHFSWTLAVYAVVGVFGALNYCTGVRFKYSGWGLVCVFFMMGYILLFAADLCFGGSLAFFFRESPKVWWIPLLYGLPVSCLVANIMHANDIRDLEKDAAGGIRTPAVILGKEKALRLYDALHFVPYLATPCLSWLCLPFTILAVKRARIPANLPRCVRETARCHLVFGFLQGVSAILLWWWLSTRVVE